jgi:dienelactone hydrolase
MPRALLSRAALVTVTAAVGLATMGGCTAGGNAPNSAVSTDKIGSAVSTRVLELRDGSRVTDPAPATHAVPALPGRLLPTTLFYPASGGPHPVVVFSHGFGAQPGAYEELLTSWAAAGFVVAAPTFPLSNLHSVARVEEDVGNQPADVSFVLTAVLALNTTRGDALAGRIDPAHIAVAGHSAGAMTTLGLLSSCCLDRRVTAAVVLAGSSSVFGIHPAAPGVPTFFVHGVEDTVLPIADDRSVFGATTAPAAFLTLTHGTHSAPFDDGTDPSFPVVRATTTDFLRWALAGNAAALSRLRTDAGSSGTASLTADRLPR